MNAKQNELEFIDTGRGLLVVQVRGEGMETWQELVNKNEGGELKTLIAKSRYATNVYFTYKNPITITSTNIVANCEGISAAADGGRVVSTGTVGYYEEINNASPIEVPMWLLVRLGEPNAGIFRTLSVQDIKNIEVEARTEAIKEVSKKREEEQIEELNAELKEIVSVKSENGLPELDKHETDLGNAMRLIELSGDKWVYCNKDRGSCFRVWDGKKWADDEASVMYSLYEEVIQKLYDEAGKAGSKRKRARLAKHAKYSESATAYRNCLSIAKEKHNAKDTDFDTNPELLNCNNGIINMRTGELLPHHSKHMCHRISPFEYRGLDVDMDGCSFVEHLRWSQDNDEPTMRYLQKALGVSFSGRVAKIIPAAIGVSNSGKSGLFETLLELSGTYGQKTSVMAFAKSDFGHEAGDKPNSYLTQLKGARFVLANEIPKGMKLNVGVWRDLSGMDTMSGRSQHGLEPIQFAASHTIWLYGNHKPDVQDEDDAIWNRLCEVPFKKAIPEEAQLPDINAVKEMYLAESAQIMAWIVRGYQMWLEDGHMRKPERIATYTEQHRHEEDTFALWMESVIGDLYEKGSNFLIKKSYVVQDYIEYLRSVGERGEKSTTPYISRRMEELGFPVGGNGKAFYKGLKLRREEEQTKRKNEPEQMPMLDEERDGTVIIPSDVEGVPDLHLKQIT